jgi:hypothetical protein
MKTLTIIAGLIFSALANIYAGNFLVSNTADSGAGSLRQAILDATAANTNSTINFAVTGTITLGSTLTVTTTNCLTVNGPGTNLLTISGNNAVQVFSVNSGAVATISGLTIANGLATGYANGAGVNNAGNLTIQSCAIVNNVNLYGWGGAIFNSGNLTLTDSTISGNQVTGENGYNPAGGGGAGMGGGVFTLSGTATITGCTFSGNSATGGNGGGATYYGVSGRGGGINGGQPGTMSTPTGQAGGFGGGGGGGAYNNGNGGTGGFGGGGGGASMCNIGGQSGFGGGAGGGESGGTCYFGAGGGGGGLGGGIFMDSGTVTIVNCSFAGNQVSGGIGGSGVNSGQGSNGSGIGADFFNVAGNIFPVLTATTLGGGTVVINPTAPPYLNNSLATITATPASGWTFLYWLGDASGTNSAVNVNMTRNKFVQAVFATQLTTASLISADPQSDFYPFGTRVKFTVIPPAGTFFSSWGGDAVGTNNPLNFLVVNPNPSVSCSLGSLNAGQYALTVVETGQGHVATSPLANYYNSGQVVTITPVPDGGESFIGWGGDASGTANPLVVTMNQSQTITANFTTRPTLSASLPLNGLFEDGFRFSVLGVFGGQYQIIGSTNLVNWTPLGMLTNTYGWTQFLDANGTNAPLGFYGVMQNGQ